METEKLDQVPRETHNEEIDIFEIMNRFGHGFKNFMIWCYNLLLKLGLLLLSLFFFLIRKFVWLLVFAVVGGVLGYFYSQSEHALYYSSEMAAKTLAMDSKYVVDQINSLGQNLGGSEYDAITTALHISADDVKSIRSIKAGYGIDINGDGVSNYVDYDNEADPRDTTISFVKDLFYVQVELFNDSLMGKIQQGLLDYIKNNPYLIENNRIRVSSLSSQIVDINIEIDKLDSLQRIMYFEMPKQKTHFDVEKMVFMTENEPPLYHSEILKLKNQRLEVEKTLELYSSPLTIIQPFSQVVSAVHGVLYYVGIFAVLMALVGLGLSLIWQYRKILFSVLFNRQQANAWVTKVGDANRIEPKKRQLK